MIKNDKISLENKQKIACLLIDIYASLFTSTNFDENGNEAIDKNKIHTINLSELLVCLRKINYKTS